MGMNRVIVETDSQVVQQALYGAVDDKTEYGDIISRAKSMLRDRPQVKLVFARRSENVVAHVLARKALFSSDVYVGSESPSWLCNTLRNVCFLRH
ncbi:hypothetical protein LINPERHAP2_LOCUS7312 [Linum perenne]